MARIVLELTGLFLLPFLAYAGFLVLSARDPAAAKRILTKRALQIQALVGLVVVAAFLLVAGLSEERHRGAYSPAIFKDGKLVPGRVE